MRNDLYEKAQMKAADLSAKISAVRHCVLHTLGQSPTPNEQKILFGISLLLEGAEKDAIRIARVLDDAAS